MLIIIEGVDGSGKSTLAQRLHDELSKHLPTQLLHRGPLKRDPLEEYELDLDTYRPFGGTHVVCDRWHLGEDVYGPMYRGESALTLPVRRHVELFQQSRGAIVVFMTQSLDVLIDRVGARGDDMVATAELGELAEAYFPVVARSVLPTFQISGFEDDTIDNLLGTAIRYEKHSQLLPSFPTYVGPASPSFLLLGERRKHEGYSSAFVPENSTSGHYLLQHVPNDMYMSMGLANAEEENVRDIWHALDHPMVVALGKSAARECLHKDIPFGTVPHPQYVRRFHHAHGETYGRLIRDAALHQKDHSAWRP
jgi:cytidylate kinase